MLDIHQLQEAIIQENLDGWLFFNFQHRDAFADRFLGIAPDIMNTRRWFYFVPANGNPLAFVHSIESDSLKNLPGEVKTYSSQDELSRLLSPLACRCGTSFSNITALSYMDHGTAIFITSLGFSLISAEGLIQRTMGLLSRENIKAHEIAAGHLYRIVSEIWKRISESFKSGIALTEKEIQNWILEDFEKNGLITEHSPIVAVGKNTGNPHYEPGNNSAVLEREKLIQFDLWARLPGPEGVYADISQVGYLGSEPGKIETELFQAVCDARDTAVELIKKRLSLDLPIRGREVDHATRKVLIGYGKEDWICHRTGHAIDRELHGWGVNMDTIEFPDDRFILEGSCFSIEPGLYSGEIGCRTEIDVYILEGEAKISGGPEQNNLLTLE